MKYLVQYYLAVPESLAFQWDRTEARTPEKAALSGLTANNISKGEMIYAFVAIDTPENKHKNEQPICVHRFDIAIERETG